MEEIKKFQIKRRPLSFSSWLKRQRHKDSAVGDLSRDVCHDSDWPRGRTLKRFLDYLTGRYACPGAIQALQQAWAEFEQLKKPRRVT